MKARMLRLHHKTYNKLLRWKKEAEQDGVYRVAKRLHAVLLNHEGKTSGEIANLLKTSRSCVTQWLADYDAYGEEGLLEGYHSGRPAGLPEQQKLQLGDIIESGPVAYGYLSGVWTSPMITKVIEQEFGICYHPGHVRRLLAQMNFSVQRPKRILAKADKAKQDRWRRYTYPDIKKKPAPKRRP